MEGIFKNSKLIVFFDCMYMLRPKPESANSQSCQLPLKFIGQLRNWMCISGSGPTASCFQFGQWQSVINYEMAREQSVSLEKGWRRMFKIKRNCHETI